MAALNRPKEATYVVHESVTVDTDDREDHTFCGIMFPIKAKSDLPVRRLVINSISVRGELGPITVWVTKDDYHDDETDAEEAKVAVAAASRGEDGGGKKPRYNLRNSTARNGGNNTNRSHGYDLRDRAVLAAKSASVARGEISMRSRDWTQLYSRHHPPSYFEYRTLDLSTNPIILRPGQVRGVYVHSSLPGDRAVVYDNRHHETVSHEDGFLQILSGRAHVSTRPFGSTPIWGWGNAWRDNREFVGRISYGAVYKLWDVAVHRTFGTKFQGMVRTLFLCQRRWESPFSMLPDDCILFVANMCRWDWVGDDEGEMKTLRKERRRVQRRREREREEEEEEERRRSAARAERTRALASSAANTKSTGDRDDENDGKARAVSGEAPVASCVARRDQSRSGADGDDSVGSVDHDAEANVEDGEEGGDDSDSDDDEEEEEEEEENDPEEESDDDSDDDDGSDDDSDAHPDYDGYRDMNPLVFRYRDYDSEDSEDEDRNRRDRDEEARRQRSWLRSRLARIHVLRAFASVGDE